MKVVDVTADIFLADEPAEHYCPEQPRRISQQDGCSEVMT